MFFFLYVYVAVRFSAKSMVADPHTDHTAPHAMMHPFKWL